MLRFGASYIKDLTVVPFAICQGMRVRKSVYIYDQIVRCSSVYMSVSMCLRLVLFCLLSFSNSGLVGLSSVYEKYNEYDTEKYVHHQSQGAVQN